MPLLLKRPLFIPGIVILLLTGNSISAQFVFKKTATLSHNTAFSITRDRMGFLWIGTGNGLNRFDGTETRVYKPSGNNKAGEMKGRLIKSRLLEDDKDRIWFSTDIAVQCFDKKKDRFTSYSLNGRAGFFANPVTMTEDRLWLATISDGVFLLNTTTGESSHYPLTIKDESGNNINLMYQGVNAQHTLWFATNKGLLGFDTKTKKWHRYLEGKPLYAVTLCQDTLFAAEGKQLRWFHTGNKTSGLINFRITETIHTLHTDGNNNVWIADAKGNIYEKSATQLLWKGSINGSTISSTGSPVYAIYSDTAGTVWAGTYTMGLWKAETGDKVFSVWPAPGINTDKKIFISSILEEENNTLLLGTLDKGMISVNKITGVSTDVYLPNTNPKLIYGRSVPLIQKDSKGNIWSSISGYLQVKEKSSPVFRAFKIPVPSNALLTPQLWCISEYAGGWLAGTTTGLYHIGKNKKGYHIRYLPAFGQERIIALWISPENNIWIAYESGGVSVMNGPDHFYPYKKIFTDHNIRSFVYQEQPKILWLSSSGGIIAYHLPSGSSRIYTETDGLLNSYISGIILVKNELWVSTDNGISRGTLSFNRASPLPDLHFVNYTTADGLPDNTFNTRAFHKGESGNLYFGTPKGLTWVFPENIQVKRRIPTVRMIKMLVNDNPADTISSEYIHGLVLPYDQNNLFFRFKGIDYNQSENLQYAYQLTSWDKNWINSQSLNEVRYSNLPHGRYIFNVKAASASGEWSDVYSVEVIIKPPFWATWWFKLAVICSIITIVVLITKYISQNRLKGKIRELENQKMLEEERKRISREMHDDIGAGLTRITLMSEIARTNHNKDGLIEIAEASRQLVSNMSEIIWSLDAKHSSIDQLLSYLREQLNKLLEPSGIGYTIRFPEEAGNYVLTNEQKRNILLVTKEIVHNAVKHSKASDITITGEIKDAHLCIVISDNGKGFDTNAPASGNGMKNLRHRFEQLDAEFKIATSPGNGVITHYRIPLKSH